MHNQRSVAKIKLNKLYKMASGQVVRVIKIDWTKNLIVVHNYSSGSNEALEYEYAPRLLKPVLKIGEVSRILGKKSATIRKYENIGLIPQAMKISLNRQGKLTTRVYTADEVNELAEFFDRRRPAGRPGPANRAGVNKQAIKQKLDSMYER